MSRQAWLMWIWLGGFIACFVAVLLLWPMGDDKPENLPADIEPIISMYAPYLLPIVTFWFVKKSSEAKQTPSPAFSIAVVISLLFNLVIVVFVASIHFQEPGLDVVQKTLIFTHKIAAALSFLAGPAIGFFFGKST